MLIYPTIKMAPIQGLTGFGGGATGLLTTGVAAGGQGTLRYIDRTNAGSYNNDTTKPGQIASNNNYGQGWGHSGSLADGVIINIGGSGTYQLYSISTGASGAQASDTFSHTFYFRVESGSTVGQGTVISSQSDVYNIGFNTDRWHELVLPTPVTLNRGTNYFIGYGHAHGDGYPTDNSKNSAWYISSNAVSSMNITDQSGATAGVTISDPTYSGPDPWDGTNATDAARGQLMIIGVYI